MQLACHILAYNVDRFIDHVLENCADYVDKIYIAYPLRPWDYTPSSRATKSNPTTRARVQQAIDRLRNLGKTVPVQVIEGDWPKEHDTRNACFDRAKSEGFDWLIIQDADEFYTQTSWELIRAALYRIQGAERVVTPWYNFWKTPDYVLVMPDGSIKDYNAGFALRCNNDVTFVGARTSSPVHSVIIDAPCFHYGYVMNDAEMIEKLTTWSHSHQVNAKTWYRWKWQGWTPSTRFLNPVVPTFWPKATKFPNEQPLFAANFMFAQLQSLPLSFGDRVAESLSDGVAVARLRYREVRAALRPNITPPPHAPSAR